MQKKAKKAVLSSRREKMKNDGSTLVTGIKIGGRRGVGVNGRTWKIDKIFNILECVYCLRFTNAE